MKTQTALNIVEIATVAVRKGLDFKIGNVEFAYLERCKEYLVETFFEDLHAMTYCEADKIEFEVLEYFNGDASVKVKLGDDSIFIRKGNFSYME